MYVIKHLPEDFVVEEVSTVKPSSGSFAYVNVWKRGIATLEAMQKIAVALNLPLREISCAGNKDKRAVTEQVMGIHNVSKYRIEQLSFINMKLAFLGYGPEPVHLGDLEGNKFKITVRNIDKLPKISARFRNLFGEQRFSTRNAEIGKLLVKRDFEKAALLMAKLHPGIKRIYAHLDRRDYIGALRCLPRKLLLLFVHAYQSMLWNRAAMQSNEEVLPIVGFGSVVSDNVTKKILAEENLKPSDFVIRELPEISAEGSERNVWSEAKDLKVGKLEKDEYFEGKSKVKLEFFLPKGSYATEFIRQSFGV
ncbi:MAG: tRNA pseudouridine(13) synthase TruD [Candidatus Woesearchaeota archaeon]